MKTNSIQKKHESEMELTELIDEPISAIDTFLLLAEAGIENRSGVVISFYPDFLKDTAQEIRALLQNKEEK